MVLPVAAFGNGHEGVSITNVTSGNIFAQVNGTLNDLLVVNAVNKLVNVCVEVEDTVAYGNPNVTVVGGLNDHLLVAGNSDTGLDLVVNGEVCGVEGNLFTVIHHERELGNQSQVGINAEALVLEQNDTVGSKAGSLTNQLAIVKSLNGAAALGSHLNVLAALFGDAYELNGGGGGYAVLGTLRGNVEICRNCQSNCRECHHHGKQNC